MDGANKYQIAKIRKGDKAYTYYTTTSTSFTDKNVTTANAYYYQVRAMYATEKNGTAYGAWSSTKSVVTLAQATVSLANKSNGIRAAWGAVKGAQRYAVYYKAAEDSKWTVTSTYKHILPHSERKIRQLSTLFRFAPSQAMSAEHTQRLRV